MPAYTLAHIDDATLLADLCALVATDRRTVALVLAHLAEVDARKLCAPAACSSMFTYCTRVLRLADEVAYKRIRAARIARRYPQIFDAIADGRLHVTGVSMLAPHLTDENVDHVLAAAVHRTKTELEMLVARLAPMPDLPEALAPIGASPLASAERYAALPLQLDPDPVAGSESPLAPPPRVKPLAPERFALQVTISQMTRDKLERAQALMRHRNPSGDLADVLDRALDALLGKLEKEKFGATSRPRAKRARSEKADRRHVTADVRRLVHARDGEQCTFVSADGVRCTERGFLEFDHRTPVALGGQPVVDEVHFLCKPHDQHEAERILGADFMRAKRKQAAATRAARATRAAPATSARRVEMPPTEAAAPETMESLSADAATATPPSADGAERRVEVTAAPPDESAPRATNAAASDVDDATTYATAIDDTTTVAAAGDDLTACAARLDEDATTLEQDVSLALRGMGFKAAETRQAMAESARFPTTTFEERLRAALAALMRSRGSRCSDGPFDGSALASWTS